MNKALLKKSFSKARRFLGLVPLLRWTNKAMRKIVRLTHGLQFLVEWSADNPEYFDHALDLYFQWPRNKEAFPMERGSWSSFAMNGHGKTLDLCCGDGFYATMFYSQRSSHVTAIDFDREAIKWAKRNYSQKNVDFLLGDIRTDIPDGPFDNVVWDAAVQHFTPDEISGILKRITHVLTPDGVVSGYTLTRSESGIKHIHQHEYEFSDERDLARFFKPYFKNVYVFKVKYASRTNLYFHVSNGNLPFETENGLTISTRD